MINRIMLIIVTTELIAIVHYENFDYVFWGLTANIIIYIVTKILIN